MYKQQTCGFGSDISSFYKGVDNVFLTPDIKKCLNVIYGPGDSSYTNDSYKPDIQKAMGFGCYKSELKYLRKLNGS